MNLIYIWTVVLFLMVIAILIPIAYRTGRARQKSIDISNLPIVAGTILIDTSDSDGPYLFIDLEKPVDIIGEQKMVLCKVMHNGTDESSRE